MDKVVIGNCTLYNADCFDVLKDIENIDHVLIDPPYGYLNHRIEIEFDHNILFSMIKDKCNDRAGFACFGRGDLFYEWNLCLRDLGFIHKEDCTMYKQKMSNPTLAIKRYSEYFSIRGLKGFTLNQINMPVSDTDNISDQSIINWWRRATNCPKEKNEIIEYLKTGKVFYNKDAKRRENVTAGHSKMLPNGLICMRALFEGRGLGSVIHSSAENLNDGMSHPTIKPVKTLEYIIQAISKENDVILDCFMGSGSTGIACINTNRKFIGVELQKDYFNICVKRIREAYNNKQHELSL